MSVTLVNATKDGKTYYFKYNQDTNQFRIYNRINSNGHENYTKQFVPLSKSIKHSKRINNPILDELRMPEAFPDKEWNYISNKEPIENRTEIPSQIKKSLYDALFQKHTSFKKIYPLTKVLFSKNLNNTSILNFQLEKLPKNQTVESAELHFYWTVPENSSFYKESCILRLHQMENATNINEPDTHKLLNVIYASKAQSGWQMFRIKKSVENWTVIEGNLSLLIAISEASKPNVTQLFDDSKNLGKSRTFLILRIKDENNDVDYNLINLQNETYISENSKKYCSRKNFYVNFKKLHWDNFIIAPEGYMAYDCYGKCTKHNSEIFSNHLKILGTFQEFDKRTRSACCIPITFKPLPIMFYNKNEDITIKIYTDMIVDQCGCR